MRALLIRKFIFFKRASLIFNEGKLPRWNVFEIGHRIQGGDPKTEEANGFVEMLKKSGFDPKKVPVLKTEFCKEVKTGRHSRNF
jgi:hypothetical protein